MSLLQSRTFWNIVFVLLAFLYDMEFGAWIAFVCLTWVLLNSQQQISASRQVEQLSYSDLGTQTEESNALAPSADATELPIKLADLIPGFGFLRSYESSRALLEKRLLALDRNELSRVALELHAYASFQLLPIGSSAPAPTAPVDCYTVTRPVGPVRDYPQSPTRPPGSNAPQVEGTGESNTPELNEEKPSC